MKTKQKQIRNTAPTRARTTKKAPTSSTVSRHIVHHAKKLLIPHKANHYRPHLIRVHGLVAVLVIALLAQVVYSFVTTGQVSVLGQTSAIQTSGLLADTNKEREAQGLGDLQLNDALSQAAFFKAQNMIQEQYWAHVSPSGIQPWKWFGDAGYNYSYAGENLAKNYPTADATVAAWMNSPAHRDNILNSHYVDIGFAVVDGQLNGQNTTLVVALYGAPVTTAAVESAATARPQVGFAAPPVATQPTSPLAYVASAVTALSPVAITLLVVLAIIAVVAVAAHHYRSKLPKTWRTSWRVHHGVYTLGIVITVGVVMIVAARVGQI